MMSVKVIDTDATCQKIKERINASGLSKKEIQKALNLDSVQAVYKWINPNSKNIPSIDNLIQLAHLLDCQVEDLVVVKDVEM